MSKEVVVVTASWCNNCHPYIDRLKSLGIDVKEVDADSEYGSQLVQNYRIKSVPATLLMESGEVDALLIGTGSVDTVLRYLED